MNGLNITTNIIMLPPPGLVSAGLRALHDSSPPSQLCLSAHSLSRRPSVSPCVNVVPLDLGRGVLPMPTGIGMMPMAGDRPSGSVLSMLAPSSGHDARRASGDTLVSSLISRA